MSNNASDDNASSNNSDSPPDDEENNASDKPMSWTAYLMANWYWVLAVLVVLIAVGVAAVMYLKPPTASVPLLAGRVLPTTGVVTVGGMQGMSPGANIGVTPGLSPVATASVMQGMPPVTDTRIPSYSVDHEMFTTLMKKPGYTYRTIPGAGILTSPTGDTQYWHKFAPPVKE